MRKISALLLIFAIFLTSCGVNPQESSTGAGGKDSTLTGTGEHNTAAKFLIQETVIPDPDKSLMKELEEGWQLVEYDLRMQAGVIYRVVHFWDTTNGIETKKVYLQQLKPPYNEWVTADVTEPHQVQVEGDFQAWYVNKVMTETDGAVYCTMEHWGSDETYLGRYDKNELTVLRKLFSSEESESTSLWSDKIGNCYFYSQSCKSLQVITSDFQTENRVYLPSNVQSIQGMVWNPQKETACWYGVMDGESGIWTVEESDVLLKGFSGIGIYGCCVAIDSSGKIYLANTQDLWEYDGQQKLLFKFTDKDYIINALYSMEVAGDDSLLVLADVMGEICVLKIQESDQIQAKERQEIVIAFGYNDVGLARAIARFNRKNGEYHVTALMPEDGQNVLEFRTRIQMELSAGRGPDILADDMVLNLDSYVANGVLDCVDEVVEEREKYLPAALEGGMVDKHLYGVPYDFSLRFATFSQSFAAGRSAWTIQELMKAVEASNAKVLHSGYSGIDIIIYYGLSDNENTAYIDWEKRESHLTETPFLELMEFARKYADNQNNMSQMLETGELLAVDIDYWPWDLMLINYLKACFAGEPAMLGYPRAEGNGIYASVRYLYLSNTSQCKKGAMEFLRYVISEEEQKQYIEYEMPLEGVMGYRPQIPVNLEAIEYYISLHRRVKDETTYIQDNGITYKDQDLTDEDVEFFRWMIDQAHSDNWRVLEIMDIMDEELAPYFTGQVSAKEAARKLNNRVQLYLDEGN